MRRDAACALMLGLLLAASGAARAERWYQVELVAFERLTVDTAGEVFPAEAELAVPPRAVELLDPGTAEAFAEAAADALPVAFAPLDGDALELRPVAAALARDPGYRVLRHVGWRQPGFGVDDAPAVHLLALAPPVEAPAAAPSAPQAPPAATPGRVEGFVALRVGRYLHLDVELLLRRPGVAAVLSEHRRVRLGELHYFDHPLYGLLAAVYPVDLPTPDSAAGAPASGGAREGGGEDPAQAAGAAR